MTEEELRAACKVCRERYPDGDCRWCSNYADVELALHKRQRTEIAKMIEELEQVKRERDAAVKCIESIDKRIGYAYVNEIVDEIDKWRGTKEG